MLFADDMNVTQGTRERKKSAGDSSVVPNDGPGSSSVQISDAVSCVEEVISMEIKVMNKLHGNTFECLAQSEVEETAIALVSSRFEQTIILNSLIIPLLLTRSSIEVGVDCEFPTSVLLDRGNGNYSTIKIEYPWAPQC